MVNDTNNTTHFTNVTEWKYTGFLSKLRNHSTTQLACHIAIDESDLNVLLTDHCSLKIRMIEYLKYVHRCQSHSLLRYCLGTLR